MFKPKYTLTFLMLSLASAPTALAKKAATTDSDEDSSTLDDSDAKPKPKSKKSKPKMTDDESDSAAAVTPKSSKSRHLYGMAGCGWGGSSIDRNGVKEQIGAEVLNFVLYNQSFAISSSTSNCVDSRTELAEVEQQVYVRANLASLSKESAQGSGEHLAGLAEVLGCSADQGVKSLSRLSKERYEVLYGTQDPQTVLNTYITEIHTDRVLAKDCRKAEAT